MNRKRTQVIFIPESVNAAFNGCDVSFIDLINAEGKLLTNLLDKVAIYDLLNLFIVNNSLIEITRVGYDSRFFNDTCGSFLEQLEHYLRNKNRLLLTKYLTQKERYIMELAGISDKNLLNFRRNSSFIMNRDYNLYQNESYSKLVKLTRIDDTFISIISDDVLIGLLIKKKFTTKVLYGLLINLLFLRGDEFTSTSCLTHNFINFTFKTRI